MRHVLLLLSLLMTLVWSTPMAWADDKGKKADQEAEQDDPADAKGAKKDAKAEQDDAKPAKEDAKDGKEGAKEEEAPPEKTGPVTMHIGIHLLKLSKFELGPGTYNAEFYLSIRCDREPCKPDPDIANGKITGKDKVVDDKLMKQFKMKAELSGFVDLAEFPFDKHALPIVVTDKADPDDVVYEYDPTQTKVEPDARLPGWELGAGVAGVDTETLDNDKKQSFFAMAIPIERPTVSAIFKSLVPVFFMIFVAGFTLLLKPKSAAGRLSAATGGLMTVVMFHLSSTSSLPPMGYLTRMDKFMIATYLVYLLNIALSVAIVRFEEKKNEKNSELAYLTAAGAVPGLALIAWTTVFMKLV